MEIVIYAIAAFDCVVKFWFGQQAVILCGIIIRAILYFVKKQLNVVLWVSGTIKNLQ
jgi:hypothetical protein